ncbi:right-handed parallel beta-helix repeat-containing protein [bacterium]|nr:right-handed parallel beta-helix repeat-containing protein [bacterium]
MKFLILLSSIALPCLLWAQPVQESGPVFGTWQANSEHHVVGNLSIPNGRTLTVAEGVLVKFIGSFSVAVSGEIVCQGTAENPVTFTCDTIQVPARWKGIRIAAAQGTFVHTIIEHADYNQIGEEAASGLNCNASVVSLTDCIVRHCRSRPPIGCYNSSEVHIERCTITRNFLTVGCCGGGIGVRGSSHADIIDCDIWYNSALDGAGIYVNDGGSADIINTRISGNDAHLQGGGVFVAGGGEVVMKKCYILYNHVNGTGGGMKADGDNLLVEQCTFIGNDCMSGAQVNSTSGDAEFNSCIFAPFNGPFGIGPALEIQPNLQLHHNVIYTFFTDPDFAGTLPQGLGIIDRVNANGDSCDVFNNIYKDPMFVSSVANNFNLLYNSPCIDAGDPLLELDPDSTIADIGVTYYDQSSPVNERLISLPQSIDFHAAYPNPFNPVTTLSFSLTQPAQVKLCVLDLLGRSVAVLIDRQVSAGAHSLQWNAADLPSGLYFAELAAGEYRQVQKLILMK